MWQTSISYLSMVLAIAAIDLVWLGVIMKDFYWSRLGHLLSSSIVWAPAVLFYFVFALGLMYFSVHPAYIQRSLIIAITSGAMLGFVAYATYDLTNMATMRDWPLSITIIDVIWGAILSAIVSGIGYGVLVLVD